MSNDCERREWKGMKGRAMTVREENGEKRMERNERMCNEGNQEDKRWTKTQRVGVIYEHRNA